MTHPAHRPDAERHEITFAELRVGDHMTAEQGPEARWARVSALDAHTPREPGLRSIVFETPTVEGSGAGHTSWVIDRAPDEPVTIDMRARGPYADFDRYMEEHGLTLADAPQAFADWLAEQTGERVVGLSTDGAVQSNTPR